MDFPWSIIDYSTKVPNIVIWNCDKLVKLFFCILLSTGTNNKPVRANFRRIVEVNDNSASHSIQCYSCMSATYQPYFPLGLNAVFTRPMNFTDHCNHPHKSRAHLPLIECNSICISMQEETEILGMQFTGHIRGCYDKMLIKGFNQTIVRWYKWIHKDACHYYNKQDILQLHDKQQHHRHEHRHRSLQRRSSSKPGQYPLLNQNSYQHQIRTDEDFLKSAINQILICTCFSDGCNGSQNLNRAGFNKSIYHCVIFYFCVTSLKFWLCSSCD